MVGGVSTAGVDLVGANVADLSDFLDGMGDVVAEFDDEACVAVRAQLTELAAKVKGAIGAVDLCLLSLLVPGQSCTAPGFGQVMIEAKGKQTTHGSRLARMVAARVADTPANEDGEALPPGVLCEKVADELVEVFGLDTPSTSFRTTAVKARGLRVGQFRDYADGEPTVKFLA